MQPVPKDGELREVTLKELRPDHYNPRFPPTRQGAFKNDEDVLLYLDREHNAFHIADSIKRHGYFPAEPMIVMPHEDRDSYVVLEGNRRLAALKGLADPKRRRDYPDRRWRSITGSVRLPQQYTVFAVTDRSTVAPVLGFRHITGIAEWEPYAQARYVAQLVDDEGVVLDRVAELIGRSSSEVRSYYRNYWIVEQARDEFKLPDVERALEEFGVWTRAMGNPLLRAHIGAPDPRDVDVDEYPLPDESVADLDDLLTWMFGGPHDDSGKTDTPPILLDSRNITRLGRVIADERGVEALQAGASLKDAERACEDPEQALIDRVDEALEALTAAIALLNGSIPEAARERLEKCGELVDRLREHHGERATG